MNRDQNDVAPDVILGSAVIRIPQAFLETARRWQAGELGGEAVYTGTEQEVVDFVFNPLLLEEVPDELRARISAVRARIRSGDLEVPRIAFVEGESEGR
jgi:simple sugar transport system substrate-binding protein/basic membrane protein A